MLVSVTCWLIYTVNDQLVPHLDSLMQQNYSKHHTVHSAVYYLCYDVYLYSNGL